MRPQRPIRITFVVTGLGRGGAEQQLINLIDRFSPAGHQLQVVSLVNASEWAVEAIGGKASVNSLGLTRGRAGIRDALKLRALVRSWNPDIVHSHMAHANIATATALLGTRVPLVSTIHTVASRSRRLRALQRLLRNVPAWTTAVSAEVAYDNLRAHSINAARYSVLYNGVEIEDYDAQTHRPRPTQHDGVVFTWLAVGRLEEPKDYSTLLRACAMLRDQEPRFRLRIAGEGSQRQYLEAQIVTLDLSETVQLLGHVNPIHRELSNAHALVNSSVREGLPLSLIEASAAFRPIVATTAGGNREVVVEGYTGFTSQPRDPAGLAQQMARMMRMPAETRHAMGRAGRIHAESRFDLAAISRSWLDLYRTLMEGGLPQTYRHHR